MYWQMEGLTAKRTHIMQTLEGSLDDVHNHAAVYDIEILNIKPDYKALITGFFQGNQ
ncbi:MAG: hypothetical protein HQL13_04815, partial [Candidatus Omnitrophica bacterium]|nr:hypothetical protein [Candidatus Omnitrophota bacterium]